MNLSAFYSLLAVTSFTLVGLWWMVIERRPRWLVVVLYVAVLVLGVAPELAVAAGWTPLVVGGVLLVLLIVLAHGLTWEFLMEPEDAA